MLFHVALDEAGHFRIERGHDLVEHLDSVTSSPRWTRFSAISRPMNPPPTTTARFGFVTVWNPVYESDSGSNLRAPVNPLADAPGVRHGPHREDPRKVDAGQRRTDRRRPGRQHELVVFLGGHLAGGVVLAGPRSSSSARCRPPRSASGNRSRTLRAKHLFRRHQEARLFFNHAADMVGKPAVRVRNIRPALHHEDFGLFVQPAQARRTRRAAGHSANDDDFQFPVPLCTKSFAFASIRINCPRPRGPT